VLQNERDNKSKEVRLLVQCLETVRKEVATLLEKIVSNSTSQTAALEAECRHIDTIIAKCLGFDVNEENVPSSHNSPSNGSNAVQNAAPTPTAVSAPAILSAQSNQPSSCETSETQRQVSKVAQRHALMRSQTEAVKERVVTRTKAESDGKRQTSGSDAIESLGAGSRTSVWLSAHIQPKTTSEANKNESKTSSSTTTTEERRSSFSHVARPMPLPPQKKSDNSGENKRDEPKPPPSPPPPPPPPPSETVQSISPPTSPLTSSSRNKPELIKTLRELRLKDRTNSQNGEQQPTAAPQSPKDKEKKEKVKFKDKKEKEKTYEKEKWKRMTFKHKSTNGKMSQEKSSPSEPQVTNVTLASPQNEVMGPAVNILATVTASPSPLKVTQISKEPQSPPSAQEAMSSLSSNLSPRQKLQSQLPTQPMQPQLQPSVSVPQPQTHTPTPTPSPIPTTPTTTPTTAAITTTPPTSALPPPQTTSQAQGQSQGQSQIATPTPGSPLSQSPLPSNSQSPEKYEKPPVDAPQASSSTPPQATPSSALSKGTTVNATPLSSSSTVVSTAASAPTSSSSSTTTTTTTSTPTASTTTSASTTAPPVTPSKELYNAMKSRRSFVLQKSIRGGKLEAGNEENVQMLQPIQFVLKELINTEQSYLKDLKTAIAVYAKPLEDPTSSPIKQEEACQIFLNMDALIPLSEELLSELRKIDFWKPETYNVGKIFLQLLPKFRLYTGYCHAQADSDRFVKELRKNNKAFSNFLEEAKKKTNRCDIHDFLIKPLQRITKYPLLIAELEKETEDNYPDKENLRQAKKEMENVVKHTNEVKRLQEDLLKRVRLDEILLWEKYQKRNPNEPVLTLSDMDHLVFVREGELREPKKRYKLHAYLFNELMIIAKSRSGVSISLADTGSAELVVKYVIPTNCLVIWKAEESPAEKMLANAFTLVRTDTKFKVTLIANSEIDKLDWISKLNQCAFNLQ
jgi:hypothetical protein